MNILTMEVNPDEKAELSESHRENIGTVAT